MFAQRLILKTERVMIRQQISIKRGKSFDEYYIRGEEGNESVLTSKEIGEIVGYNETCLLCKAGGKYKIYTLQGEAIDMFEMYINSYPLRICVPVGQDLKLRVIVEDEEEESVWRKRISILRSFKQHTIEGMIDELLKQLEERKYSCPELELFYKADKNLSRFLQEYLDENKDLCTDNEKLGRLVLSLVQNIY